MHHNDNQQLNFPKLPKICVIGPQSSGKSTVLARLLGHDIFPIGNNLTTKCVIEIKLRNNCTISCYKKKKKTCVTDSNQQFNHLLKKLDLFEQLNRINSNSCDKNNTCDKKTDQSKKVQHLEEYAVFDDMPDKIIPIENVKQEIITRMNQKQPLQFESDAQKDSNSPLSSPNHKLPQNVTKKSHAFFSENLSSFSNPYHNLNISRKVIKVTVFLHNILPLTLVDTPGIIHIPKFGQNQNMALLSKAIAREYIQKCDLILSIINGSVDLVNSESLSLIKSEGCLDKTIGVLTKIDLGLVSEIEKILTNKEIPLRHGYFGLMSISSSGFLGDLA
ncbi:Dynamin-like protein, partial [Pseudoloma neurophilia]